MSKSRTAPAVRLIFFSFRRTRFPGSASSSSLPVECVSTIDETMASMRRHRVRTRCTAFSDGSSQQSVRASCNSRQLWRSLFPTSTIFMLPRPQPPPSKLPQSFGWMWLPGRSATVWRHEHSRRQPPNRSTRARSAKNTSSKYKSVVYKSMVDASRTGVSPRQFTGVPSMAINDRHCRSWRHKGISHCAGSFRRADRRPHRAELVVGQMTLQYVLLRHTSMARPPGAPSIAIQAPMSGPRMRS